MRVCVKLFSLYRDAVGGDEVCLDLDSNVARVQDLISRLFERYPELRALANEHGFIILVDGRPIDLNETLEGVDEIALIPPPSGGTYKHVHVALFNDDKELDVSSRIDALAKETATVGGGAIALFIGFVKGMVEGVEVSELVYEAYEPYASRKLKEIAEEECSRDSVLGIEIFHRIGSAKPGEKTLYVAVVARDRSSAIETLKRVVERVKHEVPIFKLEKRRDGEYWIVGDGKRIPRSKHKCSKHTH